MIVLTKLCDNGEGQCQVSIPNWRNIVSIEPFSQADGKVTSIVRLLGNGHPLIVAESPYEITNKIDIEQTAEFMTRINPTQ